MSFAGFGASQERFGCKKAKSFIGRLCEGLEE